MNNASKLLLQGLRKKTTGTLVAFFVFLIFFFLIPLYIVSEYRISVKRKKKKEIEDEEYWSIGVDTVHGQYKVTGYNTQIVTFAPPPLRCTAPAMYHRRSLWLENQLLL